MSAIPVYTDSPITAAKPDGVTPKTAASPSTPSTQRGPAINLVTTAAAPFNTNSNLAAKPGAAAMPAPTGALQRYLPVQSAPIRPTPTRNTRDDESSDNGPPAPQPGPFPTSSPTSPNDRRGNLPPPPKAGEKYQPPHPTGTLQPYPRQMNIPPPTGSFGTQGPRSSTSASTTPSVPYPVPLPSDNYGAPRRSLEHPPGYIQNNSDVKSLSNTGSNESSSLHNAVDEPEADGLWNTAKSWASTAGKMLSQAEDDMWKGINRKK